MDHILSIDQFDRSMMDRLFHICHDILEYSGLRSFKKDGNLPMAGKTLATIFFEPSTRTRLSFESAFIKLGGQILSVENAFDNSSNAKGESFQDTIRTISNYADFIVFRHPETDSALAASKVSNCPIINAGDGAGEHPTQALLDLYTIFRARGGGHAVNNGIPLDDLKLAIIGDLKHARTINSLKKALANYQVEIFEINNFEGELTYNPYIKFLETCDVIYMTRKQIERHNNDQENNDARLSLSKSPWTNNAIDLEPLINEKAVVLHPLPRGPELNPSFDNDPRVHYWQQVKNGLVVRQALILALAGYIKL